MSEFLVSLDAQPASVVGLGGPVRVGVFGAGKAAKFHLAALDLIDGAVVAGICSRSGTSAEALARARPGTRATDDPSTLIDRARIDAAIVAVSHDQTEALAGELLDAGIPVLVEKPAALTSAGAEQLGVRAAATGTLGVVGVNRRYYSLVQQAITLVRQRGPIRGVVVEGHEQTDSLIREQAIDGSMARRWLLLNSIHFVDLLRHVGGAVEEVVGVRAGARIAEGDQFHATVRFANGCLGTYVAHWNSAADPMLRVYGEEISVEVRLSAPEEAFVRTSGRRRTRLTVDPADQAAKAGVLEQDVAFLGAVRDGTASAPWPASDLADHAASLRLVEAIYALPDGAS